MSNSAQCAECDRPIDVPGQKYCPSCGQPTPANVIDWKFLTGEVTSKFVSVDKGILYTAAALFTRPGAMISGYLNGKRKGYTRPLTFVTVIGALAATLKYMIGDERTLSSLIASSVKYAYIEQSPGLGTLHPTTIRVRSAFVTWALDNVQIFLIFLIPVFAAVMFVAMRSRESKVSYAHWMVISCYFIGQALCVYMIFASVGSVVRRVGLLDIPAMIAMQTWAAVGLFNAKKRIFTIARFVAGYLAYFILLITAGYGLFNVVTFIFDAIMKYRGTM